jgi:hypothetical protein
MDQHYEERFFESVIELEKEHYDKFLNSRTPIKQRRHLHILDGIRATIWLFAEQVGKPMLERDSVADYYQRWLSMEYSQTDIPDKIETLEDKLEECDRARRASWHKAKDIMLD